MSILKNNAESIRLNPMVSVIIPLYNQERYFNACMRSVASQTYKNLEIIIVNDGSTDSSLSIAKKWSNKDNRVVIIDKENEGVTWARRDGLLRANGEYLAFVDSDDFIPQSSIKSLLDAACNNNADLVIGGIVRKLWFVHQSQNPMFSFPYDKLIIQPQLFDDYYIGFAKNNVFPVPMYGRLYRKSIVDKALEETELFSSQVSNMGEDQLFNFRLFPYLNSMYRISDIVYYYRYGGMTTRYNPYVTQLLDYSDIRLASFDLYGYEKGYRSLFIEYVNMLYGCASLSLQYEIEDKPGIIKFYKNEIDNRVIATRAIEYFKNNPPHNPKAVNLLIERDYEGMYNLADYLMKLHCSDRRYKAKLVLNKILLSVNRFF